MSLTIDRNDPDLGHGSDKEKTSQNKKYLVLSDEEIAKGLVRPIRTKYIHVGEKIEYSKVKNISILPESEQNLGYYGYLEYNESEYPLVGRGVSKQYYEDFITKKSHTGGCGVETKMHEKIAETYARDPKFYGATYCVGCGKHLPVSEFVWSDNEDEQVGS